MQELAVGLHRLFARTLSEADLFHGKRTHFPGNFFAADRLSVLLKSVYDRILEHGRK
jgi:hypothetical protein